MGLFVVVGFHVCWVWGILICGCVGGFSLPDFFPEAEALEVEGTDDVARSWAFLIAGPMGLSGWAVFGGC